MKEAQTNFELYEPASPEALIPDSWVEPWMLVALGVLILITALYFLLRKKKSAPSDPLAARKAAYKEALASLEQIQADTSREAAVQSSLVLRKYLSLAAQDPALFETHEEFISRRNSLGVLTDDARLATESSFARLAALKYAREVDDTAPLEIVKDSRNLLETLNQGFRA